MKILLLAGITYILLLALDKIWFSFTGSYFKSQIEHFIRLQPDGSWSVSLLPAALVYLLMTIGIVFIVTTVATSTMSAALIGACFGLILYGVFDLTNMAILKDWPLQFVVVDMLWGTVLCGVVATILKYIDVYYV